MAEAFKKIHPKAYHHKFLEAKCRADGRALTTVRKTTIANGPLSSADGSSMVKIGNTTVVCGLKLEVGTPYSVAPKDGRLVVAVGLSPLCSSKFSLGKATQLEVSVGEHIQNIISGSKVLDLSELCIVEGSASWVIYADIVCLDFDGNIVDAAQIALLAALRTLRLPETYVDKEGEVFLVPEGKTQQVKRSEHPLKLKHLAVGLSFGMIDQHVIADPNSAEEDLLNSSFTVVHNEKGQLCSVYKPGGTPLSAEELAECISMSKERAKEIALLIDPPPVSKTAKPSSKTSSNS